ncbi:unnamed protein product [Amoebophrya sp. A120]|nr:unnamed protein product [Amoebophrya sp. A120]|eukprot:GSA120T00005232001.1
MGCGASMPSTGPQPGAHSVMARGPEEDEELVEVSLLDETGELLDWVTARVLEHHPATTDAVTLRKKRVFVLPTAAAKAHGYPNGTELVVDPRRLREKMPYAVDTEDASKILAAGNGGSGESSRGRRKEGLLDNDDEKDGQASKKKGKKKNTPGADLLPSAALMANDFLSAPEEILLGTGLEAVAARNPFGPEAVQLREKVALLLDDAPHIKPAKRMAKELRAQNESLTTTNADLVAAFLPNPAKLFEWRIALRAPDRTPYAKAIFYLHCDFVNRTSGESKYPFEPPKLQFATPIFHPNVSQRGKICLNTLNEKTEWSPMMDLSMLCVAVSVLLQQPNCEDPLNTHASKLLQKHPPEFKRRAREWTKKHAYCDPEFDLYSRQLEYERDADFSQQEDLDYFSSSTVASKSQLTGAHPGRKRGPGQQQFSLVESIRQDPQPATFANPLFHGSAPGQPAAQSQSKQNDGDSLTSILAGNRQKHAARQAGANTGGAFGPTSVPAAGLLHSDPYADYQTDRAGRALDDRDAGRRIRWNHALEQYRAKKEMSERYC